MLDSWHKEHPKAFFESFRIRSVEPISFSTMAVRRQALEKAGYNPFLLHASDVTIDLPTDSCIEAMSPR